MSEERTILIPFSFANIIATFEVSGLNAELSKDLNSNLKSTVEPVRISPFV